MSILDNLLERVVELNNGLVNDSLVRGVLEKHENEIIESQRMQLLEGKTAMGKDIRPYYTEDLQPFGYFKSRESAQRYADWKQSLSYPYEAQRNPDAPNLYINGKFHRDLGVTFNSDSILIDGESAYGKGIVAKYGYEQFGISQDRWNTIFESGAYNELMDEIKKILWN